MEKIQEDEFKYSQNNTFNDAAPTPKNLLATVPKLNCFILKRTRSKSKSGATNVMHAKIVLKNVERIFTNIERKIFYFGLNSNEGLTNGELFFLEGRLMQRQYLFTVDSFRCSKTRMYFFTENFHTDKSFGFLRIPVKSVLLFLFQHHEANRGAAAEQMGSPLRSVTKFLFKGPSFPELRILDPITLGNLVPIGNNQYSQVDIDNRSQMTNGVIRVGAPTMLLQ
jgi:hypothetical protein